MDVPGAAFSILMLFALFFLFEIGPRQGWTAPGTLATAGALVVFSALFLVQETRAGSPLVDLRLFRNHNLSLSFGSRMLVLFILSGLNFLFPFFFEGVRGLEPATVGLIKPEPTASSAKIDCKRFIPAAGMTVSVPCGN